jgi:hypothetical protein
MGRMVRSTVLLSISTRPSVRKAHAALILLEQYGWLVPLAPGTVVRGKARKTAWRLVKEAPDVV